MLHARLKCSFSLFWSVQFCSFVDVLLHLEEEGIDINNQRVYFVLAFVAGDNLATNSVLGFAKGFNAIHFCRMCKLSIDKTAKAFKEILSSLRNVDNYESDLKKNNFKITGLHERCILNKLKSFHVTKNVAVDIMHDLFEGVFKNDMSLIILYFINKNYFTLETLNIRKQLFDYGFIEIKNTSLPLKLEQLQTGKISMSACEMWAFVNFFSLMVGDLVPHNCPVWKFFLNLQSLLDLCLRSNYTDETLKSLESCISFHNKDYVKLFKEDLKPKAHFLIHYTTMIKRLGPLKHMWCLRFEAKHKELKLYCKVNYSRINICYSLAVKISMKFAARLFENLNSKLIQDVVGKETQYKALGQQPYFTQIRTHNNDLLENTIITLCSSVKYKGTEYKKKYFLLQEELTEIFRIDDILYCHNNDSILLNCSKHTLTYNKNYNAYPVVLNNNSEVLLFNITTFHYYFPTNLHTLGNSQFCRPKCI